MGRIYTPSTLSSISQRILRPIQINIDMGACIQSLMDDVDSSFLKSKIASLSKRRTYLIAGVLTILAFRSVGGYDRRRISHAAQGLALLNLSGSVFDDLFDDYLMVGLIDGGIENSALLCSGTNIITRSITEIARACEDLTPQKREEVFRMIERGISLITESFQFQIRNLGEIDMSEDEYIEHICKKGGGTFGKLACEIGAIMGEANDNIVNDLGDFGLNFGAAMQAFDHKQQVIEDVKYGFYYPPTSQAIDWDETIARALGDPPIDDSTLELILNDEIITEIRKNFKNVINKLLDDSIESLRNIPDSEIKDLMVEMTQIPRRL